MDRCYRPTPHTHTTTATALAIKDANSAPAGIIAPSMAMLVSVANRPPAGENPPYMYD